MTPAQATFVGIIVSTALFIGYNWLISAKKEGEQTGSVSTELKAMSEKIGDVKTSTAELRRETKEGFLRVKEGQDKLWSKMDEHAREIGYLRGRLNGAVAKSHAAGGAK